MRLPPKWLVELKILLAIPPSQHHLTTKNLERLIGKLRSMHLAIPRAVRLFYHLQIDLTSANRASQATAYLSKIVHRDVKFWQSLCADMGSRPTYLAENFQCLTTDVGYSIASVIWCRGVWIYPNEDGVRYVWLLPCPEDIMADLVSSNNPQGRITNYYIDLAALVLQEAKFTFVSNNPTWRAPFKGR